MRFLSLAFGGLLLAAALPGRAQTTTDAPATPRFYVGLAAYHSNYQNLASWRQGDTGFRVPVQLTAGYQLRPRLALELGVAYSGRTATYAYDGYRYDYTTGTPTTSYFQHSATYTGRTTSVSALARYTLTRQPAHRLQVDVLGGFTLLHATSYARGFDRNDSSGSPQTTSFDVHSAATDLLLTAGLGLRYRLTSRFGLNLDVTTNRNISRPTTYTGFTGSTALGLRYGFGK
jgi:Outer membrane protein beta-barrel domain